MAELAKMESALKNCQATSEDAAPLGGRPDTSGKTTNVHQGAAGLAVPSGHRGSFSIILAGHTKDLDYPQFLKKRKKERKEKHVPFTQDVRNQAFFSTCPAFRCISVCQCLPDCVQGTLVFPEMVTMGTL